MAVKIGSNTSSLQAQRRLGEATASLGKTYERLSSGQRINRASDDAAGLAISRTLNANARIFSQGVRNLNDGISYLAVAEGAAEQLKQILYRQRELATQASNGTYSDAQREAMDVELQQLSCEWNRVLESTSFNGRTVFSAKEGPLSLQGGAGEDAALHAAFGSNDAAAQDDTIRVSTATDGTEGDLNSGITKASFSADGRYVAFQSAASNLTAGDTNTKQDVFVKDLVTGETKRVSTDSSGALGNGDSYSPSLSADGRYVAFTSAASNLVTDDTNVRMDIFVKDLITGETKRVSTDSAGAQANDGSRYSPVISANGRYVAFQSDAANLVSDDLNNHCDIFLKDLISGETTLISTDSSGSQVWDGDNSWASISGDGRYVSFYTEAGFPGDTTPFDSDIYVKDTVTGQLTLASTDSSGAQVGGYYYSSLSSDGRYVAFSSSDIFVKDLVTGESRRVDTDAFGRAGTGGASSTPTLSADGRYVVFESSHTNLVEGDTNGVTDIFVKDLTTGDIKRLSLDSFGAQGSGNSTFATISGDGRYGAFISGATNLVSGDTNGKGDVFVTGNPLVEWSNISRNQWLSVATRQDAIISQGRIDGYLSELNTVAGSLGAIEARLGTAVNNLQVMTENFRAAESRITDADMGQESATLARIQIIQQAATSVLVQANLQPQIALQLLRG